MNLLWELEQVCKLQGIYECRSSDQPISDASAIWRYNICQLLQMNVRIVEALSMEHLSGHFAEKYDVDQNEVHKQISERILKHSYTMLNDTIYGYDSVELKNYKSGIEKTKITCILLPMWTLIYSHSGSNYIFAINGQTGKVTGSLPNSITKMLAGFIIVSGVVFTALWFGGMCI